MNELGKFQAKAIVAVIENVLGILTLKHGWKDGIGYAVFPCPILVKFPS